MSSLKEIKKKKVSHQKVKRPFTIFFVNAKTPKEILTDTIMAVNYEDAQVIAATKHMNASILYVRGIGDNERGSIKKASSIFEGPDYEQFPGARFINGKFLQATFADDHILESLSDTA